MTERLTLRTNAWTGEEQAAGAVGADLAGWLAGNPMRDRPGSMLATAANPRKWDDEENGWGVVLPYNPAIDAAANGRADDAPEPIRTLVQEREGLVLRYMGDGSAGFGLLRSFARMQDIDITAGDHGRSLGQLPRYLLLYGGPERLPWRLQYLLAAAPNQYVGRLDLIGEALENYVSCLRDDWRDAASDLGSQLIWAVDHGGDDITTLIYDAVAIPVRDAYSNDTDKPNTVFLDGRDGQADGARLAAELRRHHPGLIVTASHGKTGPLARPDEMLAQLGLLVDQNYAPVEPGGLLAGWQPDGAIWYAHACCSAGSDGRSLFGGLMDNDSRVAMVLAGVAALGPHVAPLPRALLGAKRPLRAFIGHVEPTFDWTLMQGRTGQHLTKGLTRMLYKGLYSAEPFTTGMLLQDWHQRSGALFLAYQTRPDTLDPKVALPYLLTAYDVMSTVLLGDPTALPPMPRRAGQG